MQYTQQRDCPSFQYTPERDRENWSDAGEWPLLKALLVRVATFKGVYWSERISCADLRIAGSEDPRWRE